MVIQQTHQYGDPDTTLEVPDPYADQSIGPTASGVVLRWVWHVSHEAHTGAAMVSPHTVAMCNFGRYLHGLSSWVQRVLALGAMFAPGHLAELEAEIAEGMEAAKGGDLHKLHEILWDWEATIEEAATGSLAGIREALLRSRRRRAPGDAVTAMLRESLGESTPDAE